MIPKTQIADILRESASELKNNNIIQKLKIALTTLGSEKGLDELISGAKIAMKNDLNIEVILIGKANDSGLFTIELLEENDLYNLTENLLLEQEIDALITMHYPFPIGVSSVGKIVSPYNGNKKYIASCTGSSDIDRVQAMVYNTVYGIAVAKADGVKNPKVGIMNIDGARKVERHLNKMLSNNYNFTWGYSSRKDAGSILRGNDLLLGEVDIVVCDSLTGNIIVKLLSSFNNGGQLETTGYGYGPGVGRNLHHNICIISRLSSAAVVSNAISYCVSILRGNLQEIKEKEIKKAMQGGWIVEDNKKPVKAEKTKLVHKILDENISGVEILELDNAIDVLNANKIYAQSGMGCTGPIIMVSIEDKERSWEILNKYGFI